MTDRKTIHELIDAALSAQLDRITAGLPDTPDGWAMRTQLIEHYESGAVYDRLDVELRADKRKSGRVDGRSLLAIVWLRTTTGTLPLLAVRVRDLAGNDGQPVDVRGTYKDLRDQLEPVPDTPAELIDPQRPTQLEPGWLFEPETYIAYTGLAVAALTTLVRDPNAPAEQWACCTDRGDRPLTPAHEHAHALVDQLSRDPEALGKARAIMLNLHQVAREQGA